MRPHCPQRCGDTVGCMDNAVTARIWGDEFGERGMHSPVYPSLPISWLSQTPRLSRAGFVRDTEVVGTCVPQGHVVGVLRPPTLSRHPLGCPLLSPPCSPELVIAVRAVNLNHPIQLNYFPNDMISLVHINDQFHVLFPALF